jgi:hypothetical protein
MRVVWWFSPAVLPHPPRSAAFALWSLVYLGAGWAHSKGEDGLARCSIHCLRNNSLRGSSRANLIVGPDPPISFPFTPFLRAGPPLLPKKPRMGQLRKPNPHTGRRATRPARGFRASE